MNWVIVVVNFTNIFSSVCGPNDYYNWAPFDQAGPMIIVIWEFFVYTKNCIHASFALKCHVNNNIEYFLENKIFPNCRNNNIK